jgi:hypothetical protein
VPSEANDHGYRNIEGERKEDHPSLDSLAERKGYRRKVRLLLETRQTSGEFPRGIVRELQRM